MSRTRVALLAVALALAGVLWLRQAAPGASARPAEMPERPPAPVERPRGAAPVPLPVRDIFEYAEERDHEPTSPVVPAAPAVALPAPPPLAEASLLAAEGPRLVGLVRQAGALKAAISVDGEVVVVGMRERAGTYTVLGIDEDEGVRLEDPSGTTLTLAPPRE